MTALRKLLRKSRQMHLTITPDGPRGPRRRLAPGAVYLASKMGLPLVAMGYGFDRPWRLPTWDHFAVPRPFSCARAVLSAEIRVPPRLGRQALEEQRQEIECLLTRVTEQAEAWAESGLRMAGQRPMPPAVGWRRRHPPQSAIRSADDSARPLAESLQH